MGVPSISSEALLESYDEKGFELCIGACVEVLTLLVEFDVKGPLRETIDFNFFNFGVTEFKTVSTFSRHKLDSIFAKMKPTATIISDVIGVELFM